MGIRTWLLAVTAVASIFVITAPFAADTPKPLTMSSPGAVTAASPWGAQDTRCRPAGRITPKDWSQWDRVQRMTGSASLELVATLDRRGYGLDEEHGRNHETATVRFELERERPVGYAGFTHWNAVRVSIQGSHSSSRWEKGFRYSTDYKETASFARELREFSGMSLSLSHETGEWQIVTPATVDEPYEIQFKSIRINEGGTDAQSGTLSSSSVQHGVFNGKADRVVSSLTTSLDSTHREDDGSGGYRATGRITILPDWDDFEVIVTIDGYERWRPLGSIKVAGQAGNQLVARAVLRPKGASPSGKLPEVKWFFFELLGTSNEPGVAMNWPMLSMFSTADDPDLMLASDASSPGVVSIGGQCLDIANPVKDAHGRPEATARIDSFDFGGRTELRVIAGLADGREIVGKLEGPNGTLITEILIPNRSQRRWIAEAWLTDKGVANLPDDDDAESEPKGDGFDGDGLTLYEEYRGFAARQMEDGRVEGDPKRKDFFILNLIGSDARTGIDLFEENTGLRVIRLEEKELDEEKRIINANKGAAPHRVEQHGVVLKTLKYEDMGHHGAEALRVSRDTLALKPRTVKVVGMPLRDDPHSLFNKPFNVPVDDFAGMFDKTIVHELLHSVGVFHHGFSDHHMVLRYIPASYKGNNRGEPVFWMRYASDLDLSADAVGGMAVTSQAPWNHDVDVLEEVTGVNWAKRISPAMDYNLDRMCADYASLLEVPPGTKFADLDRTAQEIVMQQPSNNFNLLYGVEHGQHSGNEQCPMRYWFADLYKAKGSMQRETYYYVPPGTEHIGVKLCQDLKGTGVNDSKRKPQSRYGDAYDTPKYYFGNCAGQICVNDAAPDRAWGVAK